MYSEDSRHKLYLYLCLLTYSAEPELVGGEMRFQGQDYTSPHYRQMNKVTYIFCLMCRDIQIKSNISDWQPIQKSFNELVMLLQREAGIIQDIINLNTLDVPMSLQSGNGVTG
ncbi:hypothetical protein CIHG_10350 [Coccidioides immitis H538.4]|uniref:Uncharacterized protein n=1 Tax=Coccidioides immitis H538.4 TaxID=396776 RepID=A0A0J8UX93_COCIT|nr:hypothetical protein CIHG_10350 [Coccidioides immitis H538.4]